jgi:hypothetical protein
MFVSFSHKAHDQNISWRIKNSSRPGLYFGLWGMPEPCFCIGETNVCVGGDSAYLADRPACEGRRRRKRAKPKGETAFVVELRILNCGQQELGHSDMGYLRER